ncbi:hypothetical protein DB88DRAFT_511214 [Papiliotrema laurentii]|uniref:PXA domain-containing protein n=1 Tax=Papiliotrema laurentii TaxID=5418 RepID=A0AAD9CY36_PAPLA|nr:hypothetical protein DB88DRAFT_511214 [Papiliotrema laurentii]
MSRPLDPSRLSQGPPKPNGSTAKESSHLPLHRRLLFPTYPPDQPLPPLVSGDSTEIAILNERLYNFIALTLRAYILSWLPRITRDRSLLPHVHTTIIAPILAPIFEYMATHPESFVPLILHDVPGVLTLHCRTYWQARRSARLCTNPLDEAYHASLPLLAVVPALASTEPPEVGRNPIPEGQYIVSGLWLTSMADAVVKHSLSEDDYKVTMQRTMAREIIGRTVLGTVARRVGEPWFWWGLILKCLPEPPRPSANNRSVTIGIELVAIVHHTLSLLSGIWTALTWLGASLTEAPETQYVQVTDSWVELLRELLNVDGRQGRQNWVLKMVYGMVEGLMWLLSPLFDRLLPYLLRVHVLTPSTCLRLLDLLENILFPLDGWPAPTPPDPSPDEAAAMRRLVEERLSNLLSRRSRNIIAPSHTELQALLDPLSDPGCNAHLVGMLYTTLFAAALPDLVVNKPGDLEVPGNLGK